MHRDIPAPATEGLNPRALGAIWHGNGVHFSIFSEHATQIELCLFQAGALSEYARIPMLRGGDIWHAEVDHAGPGTIYGYRAHGPYDPRAGHRFNANKLLIDPCARMITGPVVWNDACFGYPYGHPAGDREFDARDSAPFVPRGVVIDHSFNWAGDRPPAVPWRDSLVYECHVKGMTRLHPDVPPELRGTYLGMGHPAIMDHLTSLGVTAVELLPVHHALDRRWLVERGLSNYWGYDTLGFFAPDERFATAPGRQVQEFKTMVRELHRAGIEVILDVVFNHTCESDRLGPTLSWRGLDNAAYYRLDAHDQRIYENVTGCGNTLNLNHARVLEWVIACLRYWSDEMHVDGFRFDLATALARGHAGFDPLHPFLQAIERDPVLSQLKLIAEPWDTGAGGYQLGRFPHGWAEWNDQYRDGVRRFWRGEGSVAELAARVSGSSDLFAHGRRTAHSSLNFVTCHDGFTLHDLVTYERKHNQANGEDNRDGSDHNFSFHWGVDGPTDRHEVLEIRRRVQRSMLATLLLSVGTPMILSGDELGHTQLGNNNAYCHDSELSWLNWPSAPRDRDLFDSARRLAAIRAGHAALRREQFFSGAPVGIDGLMDVTWLREDGAEMRLSDWHDDNRRVLGMLLGEVQRSAHPAAPAEPSALLILFNGDRRNHAFALPAIGALNGWSLVLDTSAAGGDGVRRVADEVFVAAHSVFVLRTEGA